MTSNPQGPWERFKRVARDIGINLAANLLAASIGFVGGWLLGWLGFDEFTLAVYEEIPVFVEKDGYAFGKGGNEGVKVVTALLLTNEQFPFTSKGVDISDPLEYGENFATTVSEPNLIIKAVRFPGPEYDENYILKNPSEHSSWRTRVNIQYVRKLEGAETISWVDQAASSYFELPHKKLNCRFRFDLEMIEAPRLDPSRQVEIGQRPGWRRSSANVETLPQLIMRIQYSALNPKSDKGCQFQ